MIPFASLGKSKPFAFKALKKKLHLSWWLWKNTFWARFLFHHHWEKANILPSRLWKRNFIFIDVCGKKTFWARVFATKLSSLFIIGEKLYGGVWHGKTLLDFSWSWKKYWFRVLDDKVSYFLMVVEPWTFFIQFLCRTKKGAPPPPRDWWVW